jgi:hypothetical protein
MLKRTFGYDGRYVCFFLYTRISDTSWAISNVFLDFSAGDADVSLINNTVRFFKVEMGGVNVKLLEEGFSELGVKSRNDSLRNGSRILIFWRFNVKKITITVIIYKIFAPSLEVGLLRGSVTRFWKNGKLEIVDNAVKVLRSVWYFREFNHG